MEVILKLCVPTVRIPDDSMKMACLLRYARLGAAISAGTLPIRAALRTLARGEGLLGGAPAGRACNQGSNCHLMRWPWYWTSMLEA